MTVTSERARHRAASPSALIAPNKINDVLTEARAGSSIVSDAALEIAEGNQDLSARTEAVASALQETAASMEQMHGSI